MKFFYLTRENIENKTGLFLYQQRISIDKLIRIVIIICKKSGMTQKVWYSLDEKSFVNKGKFKLVIYKKYVKLKID